MTQTKVGELQEKNIREVTPMKEFKNKREDRMVKVIDDWHPCHDGGCVKLSIIQLFYKDYYCKVCAWGADDTGVEMEYHSPFPEYVDAMYERWKKYIFDRVPDGITREWFYEHGFYPA